MNNSNQLIIYFNDLYDTLTLQTGAISTENVYL